MNLLVSFLSGLLVVDHADRDHAVWRGTCAPGVPDVTDIVCRQPGLSGPGPRNNAFIGFGPHSLEHCAEHLAAQRGRFHKRFEQSLAMAPAQPEHSASIGRAHALIAASRLHTRHRRVPRSGRVVGPEVSIDKLLLIDAEIAAWNTIREHVGPRFDVDEDLHWLRGEYLFSRAAPIYGGSQEIQRTLVAQRVLGMPREQANAR